MRSLWSRQAQRNRAVAGAATAEGAGHMTDIRVALAGNPNCGKTALFNALTGARQQVGNWPGVTVEHVEGRYDHDDRGVVVTDLPGIYSFSAYSLDEQISRNYILRDQPDVIVNIVDATNLERNLYLTTQLLEMRVPVILALNMMDLARQRCIRIEVEHLARHLGCPVIPIVASKGEGTAELRAAILEMANRKSISETRVWYDSEVEEAISLLESEFRELAKKENVDARWLAIKLLEHDALAETMASDADTSHVEAAIHRISKHTGHDADTVIADGRYGFIHGLARDVIRRDESRRRTITKSIDQIVLNRWLGIPVFLLVMYAVFFITITIAKPFIDFFDLFCGAVFVDGFRVLLEHMHAPELLIALLADGAGGGIQTVATFIPPIMSIFLCLSFIEDSGYMARAAFVMDRVLRIIGLPGKAFLPMLVGFGCNVPAILATRTLEHRRDRVLTILINPFMSCGARLPVYTLFAVVFFPGMANQVVFSLYIAGIMLAILSGLMFKRTLFRGEPTTFVMELPTYHMPTLGGIMYHTWHKLKSFILRAGQVIIVVVLALTLMGTIGTDGSLGNKDSDRSVLTAVGKAITPAFGTMGIEKDNWPATVGLFTGLFAKEAIVGTLDTLYTGMARDSEAQTLPQEESFHLGAALVAAVRSIPEGFRGLWQSDGASAPADAQTPMAKAMAERFGSGSAAFAYLLFVLAYVPCTAVLGAIFREAGLRWMIFSIIYQTGIAWIVATVFYQLSTLTRHPASSLAWIAVSLATLAVFYAILSLRAGRIGTARKDA